jgi:hypothetical protein
MQFAEPLRDRVRSGEITCSVRIWTQPHVKLGGRYALPPGDVVVDSLLEIELADITGELARRGGFKGVVDLLKVAKHGSGQRVFLVGFHYEESRVPMQFEAERLLGGVFADEIRFERGHACVSAVAHRAKYRPGGTGRS